MLTIDARALIVTLFRLLRGSPGLGFGGVPGGNCELNLEAATAPANPANPAVLGGVPAPIGFRGLRDGILQKLRALGLADVGDGRPMDPSGIGILSLPSAAAGSLTFSPNDSRTVRRADCVDCIDRGEDKGAAAAE